VAASRRHHCNGCQSLKFTRDRNGEICTVRYDAGEHDVAQRVSQRTSSSARLESDRPLGGLGLKRHVALRIPFFIPAVLAIAETDLVLTVPRTLAKMTKRITSLRTIEPPRELKPFPYFMSWHPRLTNEAAHPWLREQVRIVARSRAPTRGVVFTEDVAKITDQQGRYAVGHNRISS